MKNHVPPDIVLALLLVLILAGIGIVYPVSSLLKEREQSQQILRETILAIQHKLPAPSDPDLATKMPDKVSGNLRVGLRYYPQRDAYKYTFVPKYTYDHKGNISGESNFPEPLERRSIWWKVIDGEWQCYAGVKKHIRGQLCNEEIIIQGLTVSEHNSAWHMGTCGRITLWLRSLNLAYDTHIYYLTNYSEQDGYVRINRSGKNILLILNAKEPNTHWHLSYTQDTHIRAVIWYGKGSKNAIYGLAPDTPVFDYSRLPNMCRDKLTEESGYIFARNVVGVFAPTIRRESFYGESEEKIEIGEQDAQLWQSANTIINVPFKTTDVLTIGAASDGHQHRTRILNKQTER